MREQHDPIDHLRATLIEAGLATDDTMKKLDEETRARASAAAEFAQKSPEPEVGELWTDVLIEA